MNDRNWGECARFPKTSQIPAHQIWMIIKEVLFSDLEIFEMHQKINRESSQQDSCTIVNTPNTEKQEYSYQNESQNDNK